MASKESITVLVKANTSKFDSKMKKSTRSVDRFSKASKKAGTKKGGLTSMLRGVRPVALAAAAAIAAVAVAVLAIGRGVRNSMKDLDEVGKWADRLGSKSTEALIALQFGAGEAGVEVTVLRKGLESMVRIISEANQGIGSKGILALKELGLDAAKLNAMSPEDKLAEIAEAMKKVELSSDRTRLTIALFGQRAGGLKKILEGGKDGLKKFRKEADRLGLTVSRSLIQKIEDANDSIGRIWSAFKGLFNIIAVELAPVLKLFADKLTQLVVNLRENVNLSDQTILRLKVAAQWFLILTEATIKLTIALIELNNTLVILLLGIDSNLEKSTKNMTESLAWWEFVFTNFGGIVALTLDKAILIIGGFVNDFVFYFTDILPAKIEFFLAKLDAYGTFLGNWFSALWIKIRSGGTEDVDWGFNRLVKDMEEATAKFNKDSTRPITQWEKDMTEQIKGQTEALGENYNNILKRTEELFAPPKLDGKSDGLDYGEDFADAAETEMNKLDPTSLQKGTQAAFEAILKATQGAEGMAQVKPAVEKLAEPKKEQIDKAKADADKVAAKAEVEHKKEVLEQEKQTALLIKIAHGVGQGVLATASIG